MNVPQTNVDPPAPPGREESLLLITAGPLIWSLHFLLSYVTVAIWCAKAAAAGATLGGAGVAVAAYTALALARIALAGWRGWRRHRFGIASVPHDFDTAADRHRFLGFATLLLCGLSFVATAYVALAVVFIGDCR